MTPQYDVYQAPALAALKQARETGQQQALIVMAGGLGKTIIAARDLKDYFASHLGRVLVLCHDTSILKQNLEKFHSVLGCEYSLGLFHGSHKTFRPVDVLFASFQTMESKRNWKKEFRPDEFDYLIVDEAHHSRAKTYETVINYFQPQFRLGLTATPFREDGQPLDGIFGPSIYTLDYTEALVKGYLIPVNYNLMTYEINKLGDAITSGQNFTLKTLDDNIVTRQTDEELTADITARLATFDHPRTVIFCPSIEYCDAIASLIPGALALHSSLSLAEQSERLEKYRDGTVPTLTVVDKFNEGIDVPEIDIIIRLRQTTSRVVFQQQLFRGARVSEGKNELVVFDYVSSAEQLRDLLEFEQRVLALQSSVADGTTESNVPEPPFVVTITGGEWKADKVDILEFLNQAKENGTSTARYRYLNWSDEQYLEALKQFANELGHSPSAKEIDNNLNIPSLNSYVIRFGSLNKALLAAGLPINQCHYYTREEQIIALQTLAKQLGRTPTNNDLKHNKGFPSTAVYHKTFGGLSKALIAAGLEPNVNNTYTRESAIAAVQKYATETGKIPTTNELAKIPGVPTRQALIRLFGSTRDFLQAAGFPTRPVMHHGSQKLSEAELAEVRRDLIERLKAKGAELGRTPTQEDLRHDKLMSSSGTYARHFGSWNNALIAAGFTVNKTECHKRTNDVAARRAALIAAMQRKAQELGHAPSEAEVVQDRSMPSSATYQRNFGSWNNALIAAGLEPRPKK